MTDREILEDMRSGDDLAFALLYSRHKTGIYLFCLKMLLDRDAALDAVQDTFVRVYENRHSLLAKDAFKSWLYTIARNHCLNRLRYSRKFVSIDGTERRLKSRFDNPSLALEKAERHALINQCLACLRPSYREVLILREYHNLSYDQIASITRTSVSAVKSRLFKARRSLARMLVKATACDTRQSPIHDLI